MTFTEKIRIPNKMKDSASKEVRLQPGAVVDVVIEADGEAVQKDKSDRTNL
jgi:hypothetical protein